VRLVDDLDREPRPVIQMTDFEQSEEGVDVGTSFARVQWLLVGPVLAVVVLLAGVGGAARDGADRWAVHQLTYERARAVATTPLMRKAPARSSATWCGTPSGADLTPNGVAGHPVHWVYAVPSDGPDRLSLFASAIQADAESLDAWWRGQDPTRTLRSDVAQFSCGLQVDLSSMRLSESGAELSSVDARFMRIANALMGRRFSSRHTKYVVYYDGPADPGICGEGGGDSSGIGFAIVYAQACAGVPLNTTAAHELLHALGAVPSSAPNECSEPNDGHVCDDPYDLMAPFGDDTPISGLALDSGHDDYYGHSGAGPDMQDSPWLVQVDRQVPLTVTVAGTGSVASDVPGLQCGKTCTTTWSADTALALTATPGAGFKLVGWKDACTGSAGCSLVVAPGTKVSALFAPSRYRLAVAVAGRGAVRSSPGGIGCPPRCSNLFSSYTPLRLTAKPAKGWRFKTWRGACRGPKAVCSVPMTADTSARAVFARA
jgi:hypothetical protein